MSKYASLLSLLQDADIIDIDLSQWNSYIGISFLIGEYEEKHELMSGIYLIKFYDVQNLTLTLPQEKNTSKHCGWLGLGGNILVTEKRNDNNTTYYCLSSSSQGIEKGFQIEFSDYTCEYFSSPKLSSVVQKQQLYFSQALREMLK